MIRLRLPTRHGLLVALIAGAVALVAAQPAAHAQGLVKGVQKGAAEGNKAAGPVGGVLGGAIGGVVGVFTGVLGVPGNNAQAPAATAQPGAKQANPTKGSKTAKGGKGPATLGADQPQPQLTAEQIVSLQRGGAGDPCWEPAEALLIRMCDALHEYCDVDHGLWGALTSHFDAETMLELLLLSGFYRTVSYLTNALRLPLEPWAARFDIDDTG